MAETRDPFGDDRTMINGADRLPAGHALPGAEGVRPGDSPVYNEGGEVRGGTGAAGTGGAAGTDPDATRAEIEQTRARMSETIDEIEEQLLRKKQTLEEKLDVKAQVRERLAPVRERLAPIQEQVYRRPLAIFGGVFGAGLVLGYLTGDDDDDDGRGRSYDADYGGGTDKRARRWEEQSRRLMKQNSEQEEELRRLRARLEIAERRAAAEAAGEETRTGWRRSLGSAIGGVFGTLLGQMRGGREDEYDVEVEVRTTETVYSPSTSYETGSYPRRAGTGYSEGEYGYTGGPYGGGDYPQRGFSQGAHYDRGLQDDEFGPTGYGTGEQGFGGYRSSLDRPEG
ncbi:MAG: hypothetical protein AVDCRST_MAG68-575 [uncultured Gemmatimonadetes bacterium]|uniref:DUF3618 domain-containing protein n=1 Tax=uncultured Gemmatimonadota bacterium TaxID=203437 RepID=A0A6J4KCX2_9BACT|nr:MAG: hypothetical protein AVDCRST_MAG68-575 [uncultured Gemmatimonadota bacterium]